MFGGRDQLDGRNCQNEGWEVACVVYERSVRVKCVRAERGGCECGRRD